MSLSNYLENALLNHIRGGTAFSQPSAIYIQLHTADPGEDGTANVATNTTRKVVTFAAASSGSMVSNVAAEWTSVPASEDYTHFSLWDASTSGNCLGSGTVTANAVTTGDTFRFASGDVVWTMD